MGYTEKFVGFLKEVNASEKQMKRQVGKIFKFKENGADVTVKIFKEKEDDKVLQGKIYIDDEMVFSVNAYTTKKEGAIESVTKSIMDALDFIFKKENKVSKEVSNKDAKTKEIIDGMKVIGQKVAEASEIFDKIIKGYKEVQKLVDELK